MRKYFGFFLAFLQRHHTFNSLSIGNNFLNLVTEEFLC